VERVPSRAFSDFRRLEPKPHKLLLPLTYANPYTYAGYGVLKLIAGRMEEEIKERK